MLDAICIIGSSLIETYLIRLIVRNPLYARGYNGFCLLTIHILATFYLIHLHDSSWL